MHRTEVKGFMLKASEFMGRLDPTTLRNIRAQSQEILQHRTERIGASATLAQDMTQFAERRMTQQQKTRKRDEPIAVKKVARPASAPSSRALTTVDNLRTPRRGTLGLYISLGLCPGVVAFPIDPEEAPMRDRPSVQSAMMPRPPSAPKNKKNTPRKTVHSTARRRSIYHGFPGVICLCSALFCDNYVLCLPGWSL